MPAQVILELSSEIVPQPSFAIVCRNIRALQDEGAIKPVLLPGQSPRYALAGQGHHRHFQCRQCGLVFDLEVCPGNLDRLAPAGQTVEEHGIILYGRCGDCSALPREAFDGASGSCPECKCRGWGGRLGR